MFQVIIALIYHPSAVAVVMTLPYLVFQLVLDGRRLLASEVPRRRDPPASRPALSPAGGSGPPSPPRPRLGRPPGQPARRARTAGASGAAGPAEKGENYTLSGPFAVAGL